MNPAYPEVLGEKCYASLRDIPEQVDIVDCFRKSEEIAPIAEEAIAIGAKVLWMQIGVINHAAADKARASRAGRRHGPLRQDRARAPVRRARTGPASIPRSSPRSGRTGCRIEALRASRASD